MLQCDQARLVEGERRGCDASVKLRESSSGCKSRPARGEPARAGSEPGDGIGNRAGDAQARESVGRELPARGAETFQAAILGPVRSIPSTSIPKVAGGTGRGLGGGGFKLRRRRPQVPDCEPDRHERAAYGLVRLEEEVGAEVGVPEGAGRVLPSGRRGPG